MTSEKVTRDAKCFRRQTLDGKDATMNYNPKANIFEFQPREEKSTSPVASAVVEALRLVLSTERSPQEAETVIPTGEKSSTEQPKQTATTQKVQQEPQKPTLPRPLLGNLFGRSSNLEGKQQVKKGSSTRIFPMLDFVLGPTEKTQTSSSKKTSSPRRDGETYVEVEGEGGSYLKRLDVE